MNGTCIFVYLCMIIVEIKSLGCFFIYIRTNECNQSCNGVSCNLYFRINHEISFYDYHLFFNLIYEFLGLLNKYLIFTKLCKLILIIFIRVQLM